MFGWMLCGSAAGIHFDLDTPLVAKSFTIKGLTLLVSRKQALCLCKGLWGDFVMFPAVVSSDNC